MYRQSLSNDIMNHELLHLKTETYSIRQLARGEALLYKAMRLEAIQTEPAMFRCSTPAEIDLSDEQWSDRLDYPRAVFVLYDGDVPIGMTSIIRLDEEEAYLGQSYIKKEYRGKGLATLLYEIRMEWASKLSLKRLTISHRESNIISKAANQRMGFGYTHSETLNWLDGTTEDVLYYKLELKS